MAPDGEAPDTAIDNGPVDPTRNADAAFRFSSEPGARYECSLDGAAWISCASPIGYSGLVAGAHTFAVRATDASNNTDATPATYSWTVDQTPPETEITGRPADPSNGAFVSFGLAGGDSYECRLDDGPWVGCQNPRSYTNLPAGPHTFLVRALDEAGNVDDSPASYEWTVDNSAPETNVASGPPSTSTSTSATFEPRPSPAPRSSARSTRAPTASANRR